MFQPSQNKLPKPHINAYFQNSSQSKFHTKLSFSPKRLNNHFLKVKTENSICLTHPKTPKTYSTTKYSKCSFKNNSPNQPIPTKPITTTYFKSQIMSYEHHPSHESSTTISLNHNNIN